MPKKTDKLDNHLIFRIDVPIYDFDVWFILDSFERLPENYEDTFGVRFNIESSVFKNVGVALDLEYYAKIPNTLMVIVDDFYALPYNRALSVLAHECLHLSVMILHSRGIEPDFEQDELIAYMLDYLLNTALANIDLTKLKTPVQK